MTSHFMQPLGSISLNKYKSYDGNYSWPSHLSNHTQQENQSAQLSINPNLVCVPAHNYLNQILTKTNTNSIFNIKIPYVKEKENEPLNPLVKINQQSPIYKYNYNSSQLSPTFDDDEAEDFDEFTPPQSPNVNSPNSLASPIIMNSFSKIVKMDEEVAPPISSSSSFSTESPLLLSPYASAYSAKSRNSKSRKGKKRPVNNQNSLLGKNNSPRSKKVKLLEESEQEDDVANTSDEEFDTDRLSEDDDIDSSDEDGNDSDNRSSKRQKTIKPLLKEKKVRKASPKRKVLRERVTKRKYNVKSNKSNSKGDENEDKENRSNVKKEKRKYQRRIKDKDAKEVDQLDKKKKQKEGEQNNENISKQDPKNNEETPSNKTRVKHYMKKRDNGSEPWIHQTQLNPPILGKMRQGILHFPEGVKNDLTITFATARLNSDSTSNIFWTLQDRLGRRVKETFTSKNKNDLKVKVEKTKEAKSVEAFLHTVRENATGKPNFEVTIKVKNDDSGEEIILSHFSTAVHSHKYESSSSGKKSDQTQGVLMDVVRFI